MSKHQVQEIPTSNIKKSYIEGILTLELFDFLDLDVLDISISRTQ